MEDSKNKQRNDKNGKPTSRHWKGREETGPTNLTAQIESKNKADSLGGKKMAMVVTKKTVKRGGQREL